MKATKPKSKLTFRDLLSQLTYNQACKMLGPQGPQHISAGSDLEIQPAEIEFAADRLAVCFSPESLDPNVVASILFAVDRKGYLTCSCSACHIPCLHLGALFSYLLENKMELGLAAPPKERVPVESLSEPQLLQLALSERQTRARSEPMKIRSADSKRPWTDYTVLSTVSGKTYRVALRGMQSGDSYCSCPDFRTNTLGTCKHLLKVEAFVRRRFQSAQLRRPYSRGRLAVHLRYGKEIALHLALPHKLPDDIGRTLQPLIGHPIEDVHDLLKRLQRLEAAGHPVHVYPDAEEYIQQRLHADRLGRLVNAIRMSPTDHPLRNSLLKIPLLPYQLDGIAFSVGAGRAVLADDMGLGKTIQGVGVAELLAREAGIRKVLIVCPASLKSQWRNEINRFCDRDVQIISGPHADRGRQYASNCFFTLCNYEQVLKDYLEIERNGWDLIILDEGQRIKNWETKTSRVIKGLRSPFALVLSGTPLENRLEDLYSVVQFIDDRRLGPGFRFFNCHRVVDEKGRVLGYKHLDQLRANLKPVLLRRTRDSVQLQLPERTDEYVRIPATDEQKAMHNAHMQTVAQIVRKKFLTEMDLLRLRIALLMCRMAADSTSLVDKVKPGFSSKLERLAELFDDLADESDRKVVLFSEWTGMLDLIEPLLSKRKLRFVRLDGDVPQAKRQALVHEFQTESECRFFLTTNAGSTGLNLQAANTVINIDLPWNPAVLEQRIARAHRMGQTRKVQVFILVTEGTIEEGLLETLNSKRDLALAALDADSEIDAVSVVSGADELRSRLEILLGAKAAAEIDQSVAAVCKSTMPVSSEGSVRQSISRANAQSPSDAVPTARRERVAAAGGELLGAVFQFLGELVNPRPEAAPPIETVNRVRQQLDGCVEFDSSDRPRLSISLPNRAALDQLAQTLAKLMDTGGPS